MGASAADNYLKRNCSSTSAPGAATTDCAPRDRKVLSLKWQKAETWCSEDGPISGDTQNYSDGETVPVAVRDHSDGSEATTLNASVSGNGFASEWGVVDVLPNGGPSWSPRRSVDAVAAGSTTPVPMNVRFIPNVQRGTKKHFTQWDRINPTTSAKEQVSVECRIELDAQNYLVTVYGAIKYVRGWGKVRLVLGDTNGKGGFNLFGDYNHWGYKDPASGRLKYWDGSAWQDTPPGWTANNKSHFGVGFCKINGAWVVPGSPGVSWPEPIGEWPDEWHKGPGNFTDTRIAHWKNEIEAAWTDKFDLKRVECKSSRPECCRYKTRFVADFQEVDDADEASIIVVYENIRSNVATWSLGDLEEGLARHEFGHLLGNVDEYEGGVNGLWGISDDEGLKNGIDTAAIMCYNTTLIRRRHFKGICEMLALLVQDQYGKTYTYKAVEKGANLASPPGTPLASDQPAGHHSDMLLGAVIGGVGGAAGGAAIGYAVSGGKPEGAIVGAVVGAVVGALVGAAIGSIV